MSVTINITYTLKDGSQDTFATSVAFHDPVIRQRCVVRMLRLRKGGYVSFIELSKMIAEYSKGCTIINPIAFLKFNIECNIDGKIATVQRLLDYSDTLDMGKKDIHF